MENKNILIVEDDDLITFLLRQSFINAGLKNIEFTNNAGAAFECIDNKAIDLVVMDIDIMGKIDGIDAANVIRRKYDVPIIFHTTNDLKSIYERISCVSNSFYVEKDGIFNKLISTIKQF
jgi:CheY-like chemotaxis protein